MTAQHSVECLVENDDDSGEEIKINLTRFQDSNNIHLNITLAGQDPDIKLLISNFGFIITEDSRIALKVALRHMIDLLDWS